MSGNRQKNGGFYIMKNDRFIEIISSTQGFTLLFIIAVMLVFIAFKKTPKSSKASPSNHRRYSGASS